MFKPFFSIALIILAIIAYFMGIRPMNEKINALMAERDAKASTLKQGQEISKAVSDLEKKAGSLSESEKNSLNTLLPDKINAVQKVLDLQSLAAKNQLVLVGSVEGKEEARANEPVPAGGVQNYSAFSINFSLIGSYESFKKFLADLAKSKVINEVESLSFSSPGSKEPFRFSLSVKTFWLPSGPAATLAP